MCRSPANGLCPSLCNLSKWMLIVHICSGLFDVPLVLGQNQVYPNNFGSSLSFDTLNDFNSQSFYYDAEGMKKAFNSLSALNKPRPSTGDKGVYYHPKSAASVDAKPAQIDQPAAAQVAISNPQDLYSNSITGASSISQTMPGWPKSQEGEKRVIVISEVDGTVTRVIDNRPGSKLPSGSNNETKLPGETGNPMTQSAGSFSTKSAIGEVSGGTKSDTNQIGGTGDLGSSSAGSVAVGGSQSSTISSTPKRELIVELITSTNISGSLDKMSGIPQIPASPMVANGSTSRAQLSVTTSSLESSNPDGSGSRIDENWSGGVKETTTNNGEGVVDGVGGLHPVLEIGPDTGAGNILVTNPLPTGSDGSNRFDVANLFKQLFGVNLLDPDSNRPQGCIGQFGGTDIVGGVVTSIVDRAVSAALQNCQSSVSSQQSRTWFDLIPSFLSPGGRSNIAGTIVGAVAQTCELETRRTICRMLREELVNPRCNLCNVIALTFRPAAVNSCACKVVGSLRGDVTRSVQRCIGSGIAGAVVREQFGGLITFPGC